MNLFRILIQAILAFGALWGVNRYRRARYGSSEARVHRSDVSTVFHDGSSDGA